MTNVCALDLSNAVVNNKPKIKHVCDLSGCTKTDVG